MAGLVGSGFLGFPNSFPSAFDIFSYLVGPEKGKGRDDWGREVKKEKVMMKNLKRSNDVSYIFIHKFNRLLQDFFLLDKSYNILMRFLIELLKRQRADGVRKPAANGRKWVGRDFKKNLLLVCKYSVIQRIYCIKSSDYVLSLLLFVLMIYDRTIAYQHFTAAVV